MLVSALNAMCNIGTRQQIRSDIGTHGGGTVLHTIADILHIAERVGRGSANGGGVTLQSLQRLSE